MKRFVALFLLTIGLVSCSTSFFGNARCVHNCPWKHYSEVSPSCTTNGVKEYYQCSKCGFYTFDNPRTNNLINIATADAVVYENDVRFIPPLGHAFDGGVIVNEPTLELAGIKQYSCLRCGYKKEEQILPMKYSDLELNQNNYSLLLGEVAFNDTNATSLSDNSCIISRNFSFVRGHLSFTLNLVGQSSDNGVLFCVNDNVDADGLSSYYYAYISKSGFFNLQKFVGKQELLLSSVQLLYYSSFMKYEIDLYYSNGHISCYVNNQLFANYFDDSPLNGGKIGLFFSGNNISMTISSFDDFIERNDFIDIRKNNFFRYGSFYKPFEQNCAYFIHTKRIKQGTVVRFLGDTSIYKWALCQIIQPDVLYNHDWTFLEYGVPYYKDSMWNTDDNFMGLDPITTSLSFDSYLCVVIARLDGEDLTKEEVLNIPNIIGVSGELSNGDDEKGLFLCSNVSYGYIYDWKNDKRATLSLFKKMPANCSVTFKGDTSKFKWSVVEKKDCFDEYTNTDVAVRDICDSKWNTDFDKSTSFVSDTKYIVKNEGVFLDLVISYKDERSIKSFELDDLYEVFSIDGYEWGDIPDNSNSIHYINHRGYSNEAPENTMASFRLSKEKGYMFVETDVSITKDGVPVLLHDDTINRTARLQGGDTIPETIKISDITYDEAQQYDFGVWKGEQYQGEKVPTLESFVVFCLENNIHPYIELKETVPMRAIKQCVDIVSKHKMLRNCTWISFSKERIAAVNFYDAEARIGYLTSYYESNVMPIIFSLKNMSNDIFLDQLYLDTQYTSRLCSSVNIPLEIWTVDYFDVLQKLSKYISGVTSNCLIANDR